MKPLAASVLVALSLLAPAGGAVAGTGPGKYAMWLAYSSCMRSRGVAGFPLPRQIGDEIQIPGSQGGMSPSSPVFVSAQELCRHLLPGGGETTTPGRQRQLATMLGEARCMRGHGIPGFPDPSLSAPATRAGYSAVMTNGGVWLAIPESIDVRSQAFTRAAARCGL